MKARNAFIALGFLALITLVFFIYLRGGGQRLSWGESYEEKDLNPYGSHVSYELLSNFYPDESFEVLDKKLEEGLPLDSTKQHNYVFIGPNLLLDSVDIEQLLQFVDKGNTAFIISKAVPYDLMFHVYFQECNYIPWDDYAVHWDTAINTNLLHPDLADESGFKNKYVRNYKTSSYRWKYIDTSYFCNEDYGFVKLGTMNDSLANFAMMKHGKGEFYFHTTPLAFSNITLLKRNNLPYFYKVFSHLKKGTILWDANNRTIESFNRRRNQISGSDPNRTLNSEGPLKYILSQESFAWAWYLSLFTGLLYLIFRAKRRQAIIPVTAANTNSSLEFISTIGRLYFLQNDHKKLCLQKMKLFLSFVRDRYSIPTKLINDLFITKLSKKSEITEELIHKIFKYHNNIKSSSFVSEQTMVEFHVLMDQFYKKCK